MKKKGLLAAPLCLLFAVSGCGGGGNSQNSGAGSQVTSVGEVRLAFSGNAKPMVETLESGLSVATMAGATISNLTYEPTPILENSAIGYLTPGGAVHTYINGNDQIAIGGIGANAPGATFSHDGHIYMADVHEDYSLHIDRCYYDGTGLTSVYTAPTGAVYENLSVSADGVHLAFDEEDPQTPSLYMGTVTGTTPVLLAAGGWEPAISPNGATVAYVASDGSYSQVYTQPIAGGTPHKVTTDSYNHYYPCWGLAGDIILCDVDNGSKRSIEAYEASTGAPFGPVFSSPFAYASHVSISPDGKYMVCGVAGSYSTSPVLSIDVFPLDGLPQTIAGAGRTPFWSPFFGSRVFVGTNPWMYSAAAGFLLTEQQSGFESLLAFTATTPSTGTITNVAASVSGSSGPPVYHIHADSITGVKYQNTYFTGATSVTPNSPDVLVTLDGTSGQINTIAPFFATRGQTLHQPGSPTYTAHFTAVYNAHGKNLAPQGASQLVLDPKHGTITSIH